MANLKFSVDSALLRELGEKLVETVQLALIELVKNSYDADATEVNVIFTKNSAGNSQIKVIDNGTGMNFDAVQNYWMRIATTNKVISNLSSVFGRQLTGAKGIGRFCCRRLGGHLRLETCGSDSGKVVGKVNSGQKTIVDFPWTQFEPGKDVTEIECDGNQTIIPTAVTGTTLTITNISEEWTQRGLDWLNRQLAILSANRGTRKKGFAEDPGFNVRLQAPQFDGKIKDIREDLINAGWGTLTAKIDDRHFAVCELEAKGIGKRTITSKTPFSHLTDVRLRIGVMVDDRLQMRNTKILNLGTLQKILPEWGGVQVLYRNFRVYPYGDDDWLEIDHDRGLRRGNPKAELLAFAQSLKGVDPGRSLLNLLSMRSYVGAVSIGSKSTGFEMKLNREGFVASPAVEQLKEFVRFAIEWSTILRDFYLRKQEDESLVVVKNELEEVIKEKVEPSKIVDVAVDYLESNVKNMSRSLEPQARKLVETSFLKATKAIRVHNQSNKTELLHLRLIASTSTLLLIFSHEVRSLLAYLESSKNSLLLLAETLQPKAKKSLVGISNRFTELKERLNGLLELTSLIGSDHRKMKPGQVSLREKVERVINVFDLITKKYDIEL
jgi:signal transduction histidine kinase